MSGNVGRIDYSRDFNKQLKKAPLQIKVSYRERLAIFIKNPFDMRLNNHKLTGNYQGCRSINVTGDWRAVFIEGVVSGEKTILFVALGTHGQLYK